MLDEPVTSLDETAAEEMYSIIKTLNDSGLAVIMISHDISRVLNQAKHILSLSDNGVFFGAANEYESYVKGDM